MASTKITTPPNWDNYHFNGPFSLAMMLNMDTDHTILSLTDRFNDTTKEIRHQLQAALDSNQRLRAFGSSWSLSNVAHEKDRMFFNGLLDIKLDITAAQVHPQSGFKAEDLFLFQCGTGIKEITGWLLNRKKSMKACGASNGQTIAGAISTGVHGSAIDGGAIQDCVVGLQLITGPGAADVIYIERESKPALSDAFAAGIQSRVIRHDGLFHAALVSLGSFGIIHGVVLETEDLYLLQRYVKKITRPDALEIAGNMDFMHAHFKIGEEVAADGTVNRPYHYKLYINPYKPDEDFVTEIIYKKPYTPDYPDPIPLVQKSIFKDVPVWISAFAAKHKGLIPLILKALQTEAFPEVDDNIRGTLGEIFWDTSQSSKAFGCGVGLGITDCARAMDIFMGLMNTKGPIPGILSMRFVKGSEATLAFTRFPVTCILEVDGIPWVGNANLPGLDEFLSDVLTAFKAANIPFTLHWGKNAPWTFPGLTDTMYGNARTDWMNYRSALLSPKMADFFSNDFLRTTALADYQADLPPDVAALRTQIGAV